MEIQTDDQFEGRLGVVDATQIYKVTNGKEIWKTCPENAAFAATNGWAGRVFGNERLGGLIKSGDVLFIDLDYNRDQITFSSEKGRESVSGIIKPGVHSLRFIAEFAHCSYTTSSFIS